MVAGSARTRSTNPDPQPSRGSTVPPAAQGAASLVWPPRAAYPRTPRLPTSPNGVILGITAVTVMSSPAPRELILGVCGDEPLGGLGTGVTSAGR